MRRRARRRRSRMRARAGRRHGEVRRREAERRRRAGRPRRRRPRPRAGGRGAAPRRDVSLAQELPDRGWTRRRGRAAPAAPRNRAARAGRGRRAAGAEAEPLAREDDPRAERAQHVARERVRLEARELRRELDHEDVFRPRRGEELEPAPDHGQKLDLVAENGARVRVEGDHRRPEPRSAAAASTARWPRCTPSKVPIATARSAVGASSGARTTVTRPPSPGGPRRPRPGRRPRARRSYERDRAWSVLGTGRPLRTSAASLASRSRRGRCSTAASGGSSATSSASWTRNGPTAVRRSAVQCPPSASAIART